MSTGEQQASGRVRTLTTIFGGFTLLTGLGLALPGIWLITLGGSWYYLIAGAGLALAGYLYMRRNLGGAAIFAIVFIGTAIWAFWEVGTQFWPLVPRLVAPIVLAIPAVLLIPSLKNGQSIRGTGLAALLLAAALAFMLWQMFLPHGAIRNEWMAPSVKVMPETEAAGTEWRNYGRTPNGTRYAPFDQITAENLDELEVAWTFHHGDPPSKTGQDQNTPAYADGMIYSCTPNNIVNALDAETGKVRWTFDPKAKSPLWQRCRGVTYFKAPPQAAAASSDGALCTARIAVTTIDARLVSLDAKTGAPCPGFGSNGTVDLTRNMGEVKPGFYFPTSAPTVARDRIIIGGWVWDGMNVDEPSGVVRAFDVHSGDLIWAWDIGNPAITKEPPAGETYTRGTPNVWSTPAFDLDLGLVYLPTGNAQPDFWGGHRSKETDKYSSSIVAVDLETGRVRWHFQTAHHDLWDYDVPSQPILYDIPDGKGGMVPALIQLTKRGQTFLLDRRDGTPLAEVEERPVPQGPAEGDRLSPTQPYSVGMPAIGAEPLSEARMWGATPFDHLACRIQFRQSKYEGEFTPISTQGTLIYPGYFGGMNWGSGAIDEARGLLIVNDSRIIHKVQLIERAEAEKMLGQVEAHSGLAPMIGTPFAALRSNFMSALGVPCQEPPYGTLSAIDLATKKLVWQVPLGTVEDTGPLGIKTHLPMLTGMPSVGGPLVTASGLIFYAGTQDFYLRAFDVTTGDEMWKTRLPAGAMATPMSFIGPSGRQFIVISVGGVNDLSGRTDQVIAFALPKAP